MHGIVVYLKLININCDVIETKISIPPKELRAKFYLFIRLLYKMYCKV